MRYMRAAYQLLNFFVTAVLTMDIVVGLEVVKAIV